MIFNVVFIIVNLLITQALRTNYIGEIIGNDVQLLRLIDRLISHENRKHVTKDKNVIQNLGNRELNADKKEIGHKVTDNLQDLLHIVQKNYDAYENNKMEATAEPIIIISNPEVLENIYESTDKDSFETDQLRRKIERMTSSASAVSSVNSDELYHDLLANMWSKYESSRRSRKAISKERIKDNSVETPAWKDEKPRQKKKDYPKEFDTIKQRPIQNNFGPRKRPVGYQAGPKVKYDSYKPRHERKEGYRAYGRTSIPNVGKKYVYDRK